MESKDDVACAVNEGFELQESGLADSYDQKAAQDQVRDVKGHKNVSGDVTRPPQQQENSVPEKKLLYSIHENPPWYTCLILGMQHYLMMVESTVSIPFLLTPMMCMDKSDHARGTIASTIIFASGIVTILQTTVGVRLPIIQGGTHGLLGPAIAILSIFPCPEDSVLAAMSSEEREETWQMRIRHLQGAICAASVVQIVVGGTGIVGLLLRWITPLVIVPTILLIGLSLFPVAATKASSNWGISVLTMVLLVVFTQYMSDLAVRVPYFSFKTKKITFTKVYIFKLFPVILAMSIVWIICLILTVTDALGDGDAGRTDLHLNIISEADWFRIPYPCQWGLPTVTLAGFMGMLAGIISSIVESIGDYFACARLAGAPPPPKHAINRGIFIEGVGTLVAGLLGTCSGTTSYSQNVAAVGITRVGSRRVVQYSGLMMLACGVIGKVGAVFITIPEPVIGGLFFVVFGMISAVGLSSLQLVDLNSARNLFVLGFSIFFGISLPAWMARKENQGIIQTSVEELDQIITVLLKTSMFVGGFLGMVLDNTVPGTKEERGLIKWEAMLKGKSDEDRISHKDDATCYDLPFIMSYIKRLKCCESVPISPTFRGIRKHLDKLKHICCQK